MCRSTCGSVCSFIFPNSCQEGKKIQTKESIQQILILFCFTTFWPQLLQRFVNQTSVSLREVQDCNSATADWQFCKMISLWFVDRPFCGICMLSTLNNIQLLQWEHFSHLTCHPGISHFLAEEMLLVAYHLEVPWGVAQIWEPYIEDRNVKMP